MKVSRECCQMTFFLAYCDTGSGCGATGYAAGECPDTAIADTAGGLYNRSNTRSE